MFCPLFFLGIALSLKKIENVFILGDAVLSYTEKRAFMERNLLQIIQVSKSFPGVKALDKVSLNVRPGTIHSIMGENGAGKSTLMKCLLGMYTTDSGEYILDGKKVLFTSPKQAMDSGVSMVYQELMQVHTRSVMENFWLGRFPGLPPIYVSHKKMYKDTLDIFNRLDIQIDPKAIINTLSVSQRQMVEIAKAVSRNNKVIIFDEPTFSLPEVEHLFRIINNLKESGCAIIYISNRMSELLRISDEVSVMREGKMVDTLPASALGTSLTKLSAMTAELSAGNFDIPDLETGVGSIDELDQVIVAFNHMKTEISKYIEEIRRQETLKQEYMQEKIRNMKMEGLVRHMEIYALQAQMNPHFLFNTINTGMQLAIVEGADRTGEYMDYMARLFRHIIRNKEIIVPLRHEIEGLDFYFYLLRVRFPKNLSLTMECREDILDIKVPVSILQPLVENCIIHAFKERYDEFSRCITVKAELKVKQLVISVVDNGQGIGRERVQELLHPQSIDESSVSRVMGLKNVIQRLYFFYPDDPNVVDIVTGKNGTAVIIRIDTEKEPCLAF